MHGLCLLGCFFIEALVWGEDSFLYGAPIFLSLGLLFLGYILLGIGIGL